MFVTRKALLFANSGMTKSSSGTTSTPSSTSWTQVTGWTANTTTYPGSTISSNALLADGSTAGAVVSAAMAWTAGTFGNTITLRLEQNGTIIATGSAKSGSTSGGNYISSVTASGITVNGGDAITLWMEDTSSNGSSYPATISTTSSTYVTVT